MTALIEKLQGVTLRELRARALQRLAILREMASSRYCREMTDAELLSELAPQFREPGVTTGVETEREVAIAVERIRSRLESQAVIRSLDHADEIKETMALRFSDERLAIVRRADRAARGKFDVFDQPDIDFGCPVDWRLEPVSGRQTGLEHWSRIDYLNPSVAGDKKITWELNRHSHFVTLGQAYLMTKD